jgi:predicted Zn-dependent peptidase
VPIELPLDASARDQLLDGGDGTGPLVRRSLLPGGVRLLTETDHSVRSVAIGFWLPVGSRDEAPAHAGSTHVLEHLLFKGTERRSAFDIATAFDAVGGESNAATAKEHTVYHARVRSADLPMALDVLADMVTSARLAPEDLETERDVILEELAMAQDDPDDVGYETFLSRVLGEDTPLGRPVGGTDRTVSALSAQDTRAHRDAHYRPDNLVVTAVGDLDHDAVAALLLRSLTTGGWDLAEGALPAARRPLGQDALLAAGGTGTPAAAAPQVHHVPRELEQTHVYLGGPSITATSEDRHAMTVLMSILGGGVSSRLFQHVREERGLAYSVFSFSSAYRDAGAFGMFAACRPSRTDQVVDLLQAELSDLARDGVGRREMDRALGQISGTLALGLEDTASRMGRLGTMELVHGRYSDVDEAVARLRAVTADDVAALARRLAGGITTRVDVGP